MGYRIHTVSRLTGIARNTLLAWERRFDFLEPTRQGNGYREYTDQDLSLLQAVKRLVDEGYKISEAVAIVKGAASAGGLPRDLAAPAQAARPIAVLHPSLWAQMEAAEGQADGLAAVFAGPSLTALLDAAPALGAELCVLGLAGLGPTPVEAYQRVLAATGTARAVVVHEFATHTTLVRLARAGARLVQGPARAAAVRQAIFEVLAVEAAVLAGPAPAVVPSPGAVPPTRFSPLQLALLRERRSAISCECPNHIAGLVEALRAFEEYSAGCASRDPADAALHRALLFGTAEARRGMEELLARVVEHESIALPAR
jgi:DNA-binding transcriptional MerR regulator